MRVKILTLLILCCHIIGYAQPKLSMSQSMTITPTSTVAPFYTSSYGTAVTVKARVKNTGNSNFAGTFNVMLDTLGNAGAGLVGSTGYSVVIPIGDSVAITETFTVNPTIFKVGGGGTTVVVWPKSQMPGVITEDSLKFTVYVFDDVSVIEHTHSAPLMVFPNPCSDQFMVTLPDLAMADEIILYDLLQRELRRFKQTNIASVKDLPPGCYHIRVKTINERYYYSQIIKN